MMVGYILMVEGGVLEIFLLAEMFGEGFCELLELFLIVLLVLLPLTRKSLLISRGLAKAREDAILLSKLSSASSSDDVFTRGIRPDSRACKDVQMKKCMIVLEYNDAYL